MSAATPEQATDLALECVYRFLSSSLTDPAAEGWRLMLDAEAGRLAVEAADLLREEATAAPPLLLGFGELSADRLDLRPVLEELRRPRTELVAEYDRVFGLVPARECPPYETEYHQTTEPFFRAQQMADVAGFYRAFGLEPSRTSPDRPDHLVLELEFMAFLLMKKRLAQAPGAEGEEAGERAAICEQARQEFFRDHLAWWVPAFAAGLRKKAGGGFYAAVAEVLAALIPAERGWLGVEALRAPLQPNVIERPEEQAGCAGCALGEGDLQPQLRVK
jgi:TorA maturation chaperone TorD